MLLQRHGWDLHVVSVGLATPYAGWDVRALVSHLAGQDLLAEHALRWSRPMLRPEFRGPDKAFGVEGAGA
jgi:Mycothiol maleylpyruvate isomerase N-terminal domain